MQVCSDPIMGRVKGYGYCLLLLSLTSQLSTSILTVRREDKWDWLKVTGNIRCHELRAHEEDGGCRCDYGLTFSSENMSCRNYQERGEWKRFTSRFSQAIYVLIKKS